MKYVTRKLLKFRPGSYYVGPVRFRDRGYEPKECYNNADREFVERGRQPVAGWVVTPIGEETGYTQIIRHYWNQDEEGCHYDTTPFGRNDHQDCDYVKDWDMYEVPQRMKKEGYFADKLFTSPPNMLYMDGRFVIEDLRGAKPGRNPDELSWYKTAVRDDVPGGMSMEQIIQSAYMDGEMDFLREIENEKEYEIA